MLLHGKIYRCAIKNLDIGKHEGIEDLKRDYRNDATGARLLVTIAIVHRQVKGTWVGQ